MLFELNYMFSDDGLINLFLCVYRGVPGFAFMHNLPYMERKGLELLRLASNPAQLQFYEVIIL